MIIQDNEYLENVFPKNQESVNDKNDNKLSKNICGMLQVLNNDLRTNINNFFISFGEICDNKPIKINKENSLKIH